MPSLRFPTRSRALRALIATPLVVAAAGAAATTASAADTYNVDLYSNIEMKATGAYGGYWTGTVDFDTDLDYEAHGLVVRNRSFPVTKQGGRRLYATRHTQHVVETTPLDTYVWDCTNVGPARGNPGPSILSDKDDETGHLSVVALQSASYTRSCTGFSSFTGDLSLSSKPMQVDFDFPWSAIGSGAASHKFDVTLPCPSLMAFQDCTEHWRGSVVLRRTEGDGSDSVEPKPEKPVKTLKKVAGKLTKNAKGAKVTVTCATACKGKISATAIAQQRQAAKRVAGEGFSTTKAGPKKVEIIFGGKGSRAVRHRGGVIINIKAAPRSGGATQSKSLRLTYGG